MSGRNKKCLESILLTDGGRDNNLSGSFQHVVLVAQVVQPKTLSMTSPSFT